MKLETFFEKFDQFADAPDAVAKMRELVLRMATSGRIAEQDPADQTGSELLTEIFAVRDNLIQSGAAKNRTEGNPITAGDTIDLPPSWARCMISEVCDLQTGATPSRTEHSYFGGDIPWLVSGDINKGEITECDGRITKEGLGNSNCKIIPAHSVLIALNGQGKTRATVAVLRIPAALNQSLVAMIPYSGERLLPEYIFWNLRGRYYAIRDITGQDQRRGLNMKLVGQLSLPIPPLAEQKRIVAKVNELMALCDRLEAQQKERDEKKAALARASLSRFADAPTPANLNFLFHSTFNIHPSSLRQSILTLAVQGKLLPQDPNDEPAEELLQKITAEQERLVKARQIRRIEAVPLAEEDEPFAIPASWAWTRLGQIGDWGSGSTPPRGNHELYGGSVPWLKSGELNDNRTLAGSEETVTELAMKTCSFRPNKPGDVLLAMYGATIGKAAILAEAAVTNQAVCGCTPFPGVLNTYLFDYLLSQRDAFHAASEGGAQPNISKVKIVGYPFPLPPLEEQRRIVAKVDQLMALVDALETQLVASRAIAANLLSALVAELTAQEVIQ